MGKGSTEAAGLKGEAQCFLQDSLFLPSVANMGYWGIHLFGVNAQRRLTIFSGPEEGFVRRETIQFNDRLPTYEPLKQHFKNCVNMTTSPS